MSARPPPRPMWSMCILRPGCRSAILPKAAMFWSAREQARRAGSRFSHAFQNQSSEPSVHHDFWCGSLNVKRKPSMPGRSRQCFTISSRFGAWRSKCPRMQNLSGCSRHRLDGELVGRFAERARRMDHRGIDAGRLHFGERIVDPVSRDLAMVRAHLSVLPDVDLGIDDQHGCSS